MHAVFLVAHAGAAPTHPELLAHLRANRQFLSQGRGGEREVVHAAAVEAWVSGRPRRAAAVSFSSLFLLVRVSVYIVGLKARAFVLSCKKKRRRKKRDEGSPFKTYKEKESLKTSFLFLIIFVRSHSDLGSLAVALSS